MVAGCGDNLEGEDRQGGATTVDDRTREAFNHPAANLDEEQQRLHQFGRGPFNFLWAAPQLGRLFNHNACLACHAGNGRGLSEIDRGPFGSQALVRVSLAAGTPDVPGGNVSVPGLGQQLQDHATNGLPEVFIEVTWRETAVYYGDGEAQPMRSPFVEIMQPNGTAMPAGIGVSYRQAPAMIGLGLLEAIADETLEALADPEDADGDGISGRVNVVWDAVTASPRIGRFGHKATEVDVLQQTAGAFVNDIGLSNLLHLDTDGMRDLTDDQLAHTTFFVSTLAVPAAAPRGASAQLGRTLFDDFTCSGCHTPTITTGAHSIPQLADQTIHPYTDLLLHDVGDLLSDARSDFAATGVEWRTPPLWGLGLVQIIQPAATFLHDGRARTLAEAILWHGGEAQTGREAFRTAPRSDRDALIAFLETL
ncbi:MAG: putative thiol oxidoreductase [Myxococcales bacterium]|nr:putative thiol oxidoreductase [Myxococcales bacterium]